jgi:hypothetical protein
VLLQKIFLFKMRPSISRSQRPLKCRVEHPTAPPKKSLFFLNDSVKWYVTCLRHVMTCNIVLRHACQWCITCCNSVCFWRFIVSLVLLKGRGGVGEAWSFFEYVPFCKCHLFKILLVFKFCRKKVLLLYNNNFIIVLLFFQWCDT